MGRFSPGFVGHYSKPNYLADALNGVADTVGELLRDRRTADARTADRLSQQAFTREMHDSDQMHADIRQAELDGRERDRIRREDKRTALSDALQGIVPTASAPFQAPVVGMDGSMVQQAKAYVPLGDTGYSIDSRRTPEGMEAAQNVRNTRQTEAIAALLPQGQSDLAGKIKSLGNPSLAASLVGPSVGQQAELPIFAQKLKMEHAYDRPPQVAPIMSGGVPYVNLGGGRLQPMTLPNGEALPSASQNRPVTEAQSRRTAYATMAASAARDLGDYDETPNGAKSLGRTTPKLGDVLETHVPIIGNGMTSSDYQVRTRAANQLADAWLRYTSGANAPDKEIARVGATFVPSYGDKPDVVEAKRKGRLLMVDVLSKGGDALAARAQLQKILPGGYFGAAPAALPTGGVDPDSPEFADNVRAAFGGN